MFLSVNFKHFAFAFSIFLHFLLVFGGFFGNSIAVSNYAIKPQIATSLSFKIATQTNILKQNTAATSNVKKAKSPTQNHQNNLVNQATNQAKHSKSNNSSIIAPQFAAEYLNNTPPQYPLSAKRMGIEGEVILLVTVQENGLPAEINIHQSSGFDVLDQSAILAVKKWQFVSAKQNGRNVKASVLVPIKFQLT
jgi:protein TonB